ncbi:MAG: tRNA preQ1(34) S-adenosylmethionine ribosyltransferase-isomerase QueA [Chloroflexi bacterium]|nr:MAG: tRNA preQ1(34) S-adenosylmethionine ribosyltransferase-isomerase QueA [Chloroflexota bacterium]
MKTAEFDYELPPELVAQTPVEPRHASRLMVVDRDTGEIFHRRFYDLPTFLKPEDVLVHNESRVIPARLFACKPTGGKVEILLLRQRCEGTWEALVRGKRVRPGMRLRLLNGPAGETTGVEIEIVGAGERGMRVLSCDEAVLSLAERVGVTPLPPYIHTPLADAERYQTVYARTPGSVAAPTAGLHFTPQLLRRLREMGIRSVFVTLHIGLDTFRPVDEERVEDHEMHTEYCSLTSEVAHRVNQGRAEGGRIIAVGTTSVRVLETAAVKAKGPRAETEVVRPFEGATDLFIYPGYEFRATDALITNFHLPRSTLLMLVSAFASKELVERAYAEAIRERYRFYSFGDAMLIL